MKQELEQLIASTVKDVFDADVAIELTRPDEQFGDYATNVALQLSKQLGRNPRDIAGALQEALVQDERLQSVDVAGPGFMNLRICDERLAALAAIQPGKPLAGMQYVVEYSCPNYFKELHVGHLYQTILGDVVARLIERAGASVHRANFGGDVGLHVAKAIYGMNVKVNGVFDNQDYSTVKAHMSTLTLEARPPFLAESYVLGSRNYETDTDGAKRWIEDLNGELYHTVFSDVAEDYGDQASKDQREIFETGREWSREYFDSFYARLQLERQPDGSFFTYYPESSTAETGKSIVYANTSGFPSQTGEPIFERSDDAIIFRGETYGLHTRVFITRQGLPTYEAKDLGLLSIEQKDFNFDHRILFTGNDQAQYVKVVWKVADLIQPDLEAKMTHLTNGTVKFADGKKMSSRLGNVTRAVDVLDVVGELVDSSADATANDQVVLGAIKYELLKHRLGGDIAFDPHESVAIEGNSGPYLQYAHARARSILTKITKTAPVEGQSSWEGPWLGGDLQVAERSLLRKVTEYHEVVVKATAELMPHHICTYLYELAQTFNRFYEHNRVIGDERQAIRIQLIGHYAETLKNGLNLLGIIAPESM